MIARVHWLLWHLSPIFKGFYKLRFDYRFHDYVFYRNYHSSKRLLEFYSIVRTSKKCFRLMYYNDYHGVILYESFKTSKKCAQRMEELMEKYRDIGKSMRGELWIGA